MPLPPIALFVIALGLGVACGYYLRYLHALSQQSSVELDTKKKLVEADEKVLKIVAEAEKKADEIEATAKKDAKALEEDIKKKEDRLIKKDELLDERQIDLDSQTEAVREKIEHVKALKTQLDERADEYDKKLEEVAGLTKEEAYTAVTASMEADRKDEIETYMQKLDRLGEEHVEEKAKNIIVSAIHRIGNLNHADAMTSSIEIKDDDIKGKIIGKEGRNVRTFERATGVDVLIDDTPGYITLSSFDPIRREIARVAMETLIKDGRIQPAKIEEAIEKARSEVASTVRKMGEKAAYEAGVPNLHPDLLTILGRLHFRTSYGQNVLWHSVEMAHIAAIIAEETGCDVATARAGALLHDIGKTVSHEVQGTHVEIGIRILKKYGVGEEVILAMRPHHEEYPYETPESMIVQVADSISGSRPGARRDSIENYIKRLTDLEAIADELQGVEKAFAIAAGREIRVLVNPEAITDIQSRQIAQTIAGNIEAQLRYPGEIKVHVIRETRVISYAR